MTGADHLRDGDRAITVSGDDAPPGALVWPSNWHVRHVEETGSTNDDLVGLAERGAPDRTVLYADHQTAGRGRLDRRWDAPPGSNLLVSLLFRDVLDPPVQVTHRVGLAVVVAASRSAGVEATLKWPNDVLVDGAKLAGILAQRAQDGSVVVGLGLNVGWAPDGSASLGDGVPPSEVLRQVLVALDEQPLEIHDLYRDGLSTIGQRVRVELPDGAIEGRATGVERDGRLIVLDDCAVSHRIDVGDVVHLRPV